jgi:hypothetical protein
MSTDTDSLDPARLRLVVAVREVAGHTGRSREHDMNSYRCSLVFGHPQAPTGLRSIAELIETLRLRGGGVGLFTGCAAGDTGAAVVLEVSD